MNKSSKNWQHHIKPQLAVWCLRFLPLCRWVGWWLMHWTLLYAQICLIKLIVLWVYLKSLQLMSPNVYEYYFISRQKCVVEQDLAISTINYPLRVFFCVVTCQRNWIKKAPYRSQKYTFTFQQIKAFFQARQCARRALQVFDRKVWKPEKRFSCLVSSHKLICFATACCNSHALSTRVPASEAAWRGKARCSGLFTTGALEARPQRGCWRGLDMRAAFCWETARRCREPTVCVWGELRVRPSLNVTKSGIFSFKVSHPYVCRIGLFFVGALCMFYLW